MRLVHPLGEELKFVVELPGEKQMIFTVDRHQIGELTFIKVGKCSTHPGMDDGSSRFDDD
jgi:hypothetical protein